MSAPLHGLRVLDLSRVLAGPWCTQLLADLGADVIKVERPTTGDDTRGWGPPFLPSDARGPDAPRRADDPARGAAEDAAALPHGDAAYFTSCNRGKRSVTIDFTTDAGAELVRRLADACDVFVENFRPGDLARHGIDPDSLRARNPRLVTCSITGFGDDGPWAARAGYDAAIQAASGLMSVTGPAGGEPTKIGVALVDVITGLYAANGIQAALLERQRTERGRHVDLALLDAAVASLANQAGAHLVSGRVPVRMGNAHPQIVPYQTFATSDGHLVVAVGNDTQFRALCAVLGDPALADDARFATNAARVVHRDSLVPRLAAVLVTRSSTAWDERLAAAGVPCGPVLALDEVFAHPQVVARGLRVDLARDAEVTVPGVACPVRLDGESSTSRRAPPALGAHTDEVLGELLDMSHAECAALREGGVL
ncbi:MAG: CoA transferase [Planctomycetes bacterium]|nr:CoA transferase [Planctomycetota bacterium]